MDFLEIYSELNWIKPIVDMENTGGVMNLSPNPREGLISFLFRPFRVLTYCKIFRYICRLKNEMA
jgi:hypothetical protein